MTSITSKHRNQILYMICTCTVCVEAWGKEKFCINKRVIQITNIVVLHVLCNPEHIDFASHCICIYTAFRH